jgi:23S rRNA (cytosine1962-C5)-methyltransferase
VSLPTLSLSPSLEHSLALGHPWVYREKLPQGLALETGSWVRLKAGAFVGYALYDAESPLACRLYSTKGIPDAGWIADRVKDAWSLREPLRARGDTDAYRLVNGEGDRLPGIVVDRYGGVAVIALDTPAVGALVAPIIDALHKLAGLEVFALRERGSSERLNWVKGAAPEGLVVRESSLCFGVDFERGQKTGLFLDQRENRRAVEALARGRRVLNLYAYTGGFSLYAARGGASAVTSVDISGGAMDAARRNFVLSGLDPKAHRFETADVLEFLKAEAARSARYDLIVCDPPSFARNQKQMERAEAAYVKVNAAAMELLEDGGLLATASCTSRITPGALQRVVAEAARRGGRAAQVVMDNGHALDHPIAAGHPEGRYLKFLVVRMTGRV